MATDLKTDGRQRENPKMPRALRGELMRQAGTIGVPALSRKTGISQSAIHRWLNDNDARVKSSWIEKLSDGLHGKAPAAPAPEVSTNGSSLHGVGSPVNTFTLRISLSIKRAERLIAHCDLHGQSPSQFVADLVDGKLDAMWGPEKS